jgi:peptide deformylase
MERPIVKDPIFLARKSEPAGAGDMDTARDLLDTLNAHRDGCVGMAANMIGERKRIIVMAKGPLAVAMINPKILSASGEYETEEGCLSLEGVRKTKRYRSIRLQWQDMQMKAHIGTLDGFQAQIVQHEIDHCDGKLI